MTDECRDLLQLYLQAKHAEFASAFGRTFPAQKGKKGKKAFPVLTGVLSSKGC